MGTIESFRQFNESLNSFLWGPYVLLPLLIVVGVYLSVRLGKGFFRGEAYRPPDEQTMPSSHSSPSRTLLRTRRAGSRGAGFLVLLAAAAAWGGAPDGPDIPHTLTRLSDRVIVLECLDVRVSAIASRSGIVVIDTDRAPAVMERLRGAIERELGRRDFLYVVNTHGDPDHASGNAALPSARLIAHRNFMPFVLHAKAARLHARWAAQSRLEDARSRYAKLDPASDEAVDLRGRIATLEVLGEGSSGESISRIPDIVFDDSLTLDLGDLTLEMRFCGEAHTNHDIVVYVPEERLLFTGDLICSAESPCFPVNAMCDAPRLVRELEGLLRREAGPETVVPGHGEILTRADLETFCRVLSERYAKVAPENSAAWILSRTMEREGLDPALERVPLPAPGAPGTPYWSEEELAALGARLVRRGKADDAVRVLRLSLRALPESALLTGTLGDALLERDDRDAAAAAYARCLALMPEHRRAAEMLKAIEATAPTSTRPAE